MAVIQAKKAMIILMILYVVTILFGLLASVPMIMHVYPQSECMLFSYQSGQKLFYGNYASCNIIAYVFLFVVAGAMYLFVKCWMEKNRRSGHAKAGEYEDQHVPKNILMFHIGVFCLSLLLTIMVTAGYINACNNLHEIVSKNVQQKLNANPFDTRGEEILTRYEDDYKFHRYTNRYGNAFGSEFYTIRITCRSILTDPEIHQKLHDTHADLYSRYHGYWYQKDLYPFKSEYESTKTNALIETSLAGAWLNFAALLAGLILMIIQRCVLKKQAEESERMSMHSNMMGSMYRDGSVVGAGSYVGAGSRPGTGFNGSVISGSNFQRGGSMRGSDRSIKSTRRDIDDIALSMHHIGGSQRLLPPTAPVVTSTTGYGRKEFDDMVRPRSSSQSSKPNSHHKSHAIFNRENSLQMEVEQPHGIMLLAGDGLLQQQEQLLLLQQQQVQQQQYLQQQQQQLLLHNGFGDGTSSGVGVMVKKPILNQHIAQNRVPAQRTLNPNVGYQAPPSHYSSHETGYNTEPESTFLQREEVETEIF